MPDEPESPRRKHDRFATSHLALAAAASEAAVHLRALGAAATWLDRADFPPAVHADRFAAEAEALEAAVRATMRQRAKSLGARDLRQVAASAARAWVRALRTSLDLAVQRRQPEAERVLGALRAAGRLDSTIAATRRVLDAAIDALAVAGPPWAADLAAGREHRDALTAHDTAVRDIEAALARSVDALAQARATAVDHLRELHTVWRLAVERSEGQLAPLTLRELGWTTSVRRRKASKTENGDEGGEA